MSAGNVLPSIAPRGSRARLLRDAKSARVNAALDVDVQMRARFEDALEETVGRILARADGSPIADQVRWHFGIGSDALGRGKRLRPRILLHVAVSEGATFDAALDAALAVECLHNYSLVHDDLEDGDELRHGRQTVWHKYGVSHGINAGDSMCAVSYLTLLRNRGQLEPERLTKMVRVLHEANFTMCAGQGYDITFESAPSVDLDDYLRMVDGKTAVLFGAACELGALCAGAGESRASAYAQIGRAYGRAFQIRDDVLGTWGSTGETGKAPRCDIARRKWIFPIVWALAGPASPMREAIRSRYGAKRGLGPDDVAFVVGALDALGARAAAERAWLHELRAADRVAERWRIDRDGALRARFSASFPPPPYAVSET